MANVKAKRKQDTNAQKTHQKKNLKTPPNAHVTFTKQKTKQNKLNIFIHFI